jgi:hypothetical protein
LENTEGIFRRCVQGGESDAEKLLGDLGDSGGVCRLLAALGSNDNGDKEWADGVAEKGARTERNWDRGPSLRQFDRVCWSVKDQVFKFSLTLLETLWQRKTIVTACLSPLRTQRAVSESRKCVRVEKRKERKSVVIGVSKKVKAHDGFRS